MSTQKNFPKKNPHQNHGTGKQSYPAML